MNNIIDNFINQNKNVVAFLKKVGRDYENADVKLEIFKQFLVDTKYNAALGIDLANFLQWLDKEKNLSDFELSDIRQLFDSLITTQEFNIDTYVEAGHFEWAIVNDKQKAIEIIKNGLCKATEKIEELKRLLDTIQSEE